MAIQNPFPFRQWINEHRDLLRPPVMNQLVYRDNENFIIMVVGGPNRRKDFHVNSTEEFFYQLEGNITIRIMEDGVPRDISLSEGDIFLLPPNVPHSPRRTEGSVGLVVEIKRPQGTMDGFQWYCENCNALLHEARIPVNDIVKDLPEVMNAFWKDESLRSCRSCGEMLEKP